MAEAKGAGQASAPEGALSPGARKLARGYGVGEPFLEVVARLRNEVEVDLDFDDLEAGLVDQLQQRLGLEPLEEQECPTSQARSEGLGFSWDTIDFCLGRWSTDIHVHGHITSGGNTAGAMWRFEVRFIKMLEA
jgi:hypothetical protein